MSAFINLKERFTQYIDRKQIHYFDEAIRQKNAQLIESEGPQILESNAQKWLKDINAFKIYDLLKNVGIQFSGEVMELGAGHSWFTSLLSKEPRVSKVYSVDCSEYLVHESSVRMFTYLQADTSKIIRVLGDFHNLDYWKPESIDYVVMDAAFHHTDYPDVVLREVARVLRKNGLFVATRETFVPILRPDLVKKHYALAKETRTVENLHRRALIKRMAKENGYRFRHYLLYFPVGFVGKWKQAILEITDGYLTMCNVAFVFEKI